MLFLVILIPAVRGLIGFDCGGQNLNVTTVSLLGVGDCDLKYKTPNSTETYIQLLQLSDYNFAEVFQCKVEISRTIYHCGMHSHISVVQNGMAEYVQEVGRTRCTRMFEEGVTTVGAAGIIDGIKANSTISRSITLAGTIGHDGSCKGTQYSDPYGTWDDVVVQASVKVSLKSFYAPVNLNVGKIKLRSGITCLLSDGFCIDPDDGYTYWKPMPTTSCNFHQYDVLYEGPATKVQDDSGNPQSSIIYSLVTEDITFALTKTKEQPLCGYTLLRTEHPKLFILETRKGDTFARRGNVPVENLDIFAYVNSKFVYVEKHVRNQMTSLYYNVMQQRCELEKEVIKNTLSFATFLPDEFAYRLMKGPGYMAVTAGEVIHVIKCIPVDVMVRKTQNCFIELPVVLRNASLFLTPKSRILTKLGTEKECSHELPTMYRLEDTWIQFTPEIQIRELPPQQMKPMAKLTWKYLTPGPLAVSGIYSEKDIEKLRDHIMFPAEKPALLNSVARGLNGMSTGTASMYNLLDEDSLNRIAESAASRVWKGFMNFGSATAGILGIFIIIRLIKIILDTAVHGYALHAAYGCSVHLFGAIWNALANFLLHLAQRRAVEANGQIQENEGATEAQSDERSVTNRNTGRSNNQEISHARREDVTSHITEVPTTFHNLTTPSYAHLREHLEGIEQIPQNTSGICSKNGREV